MDRREGKEAVELRSRINSNERPSTLQFPTANTIVSGDLESFIGDVINLVNDATIDGFNNVEEFAAKTLNLEGVEDRTALTRGVDNVYHIIQDEIDSSLRRWETLLQERYFNFSPSGQIDCNLFSDSGSKKTDDLDLEEQKLDSELIILRNQLLLARREGAKLRRELNTLEKQLALRMEVWSEVKSLDETVDEVFKSAFLLNNTIIKVNNVSYDRTVAGAMQESGAMSTPEEKVRSCS